MGARGHGRLGAGCPRASPCHSSPPLADFPLDSYHVGFPIAPFLSESTLACPLPVPPEDLFQLLSHCASPPPRRRPRSPVRGIGHPAGAVPRQVPRAPCEEAQLRPGAPPPREGCAHSAFTHWHSHTQSLGSPPTPRDPPTSLAPPPPTPMGDFPARGACPGPPAAAGGRPDHRTGASPLCSLMPCSPLIISFLFTDLNVRKTMFPSNSNLCHSAYSCKRKSLRCFSCCFFNSAWV